MSTDYDGRQYVGIDLHRRRSVIVRMTPDGEQLDWVHIDNDPVALGLELAKAGPDPRWCWKPRMAGTGRWIRCRPRVPGCICHTRWG